MFNYINHNYVKSDDVTRIRIKRKDVFINTSNLVWEGDNEFKYNDKLYDIIKIDKSNEEIVLLAVNDIQEENLLKSFSEILDEIISEKSNNPRIRTIIFNFISQAISAYIFLIIPPTICIDYVKPSSLINYYVFINPISPPPKSVILVLFN